MDGRNTLFELLKRAALQAEAKRKAKEMGKVVPLLFAAMATLLLTGCGTMGKVTESASGKNLNLEGYVMLGEIETVNPETATPQGKIIIGRATYRSRKVGIPADQKVPTTGYFKATNSENLFGVKEQIIEYDFTAGSDADAKSAEDKLREKAAAAEKAFAETAQTEKSAASPPAAKTEISSENK